MTRGGAPNSTTIDALRGIAALLVLASHADAYDILRITWSDSLKVIVGETGVYLFFLLSGYLIWTSAERVLPNGLKVYAVHRLTRILPLYLVALAAVLALTPLFMGGFKPDWDANSILRHLTFTQDLDPRVSRDINPVLWTLTHEAIFYALTPLLWRARAVAWLFLAVALVAVLYVWRQPVPVFASFLVVAYLFAIGVTIARYNIEIGWPLGLAAAIAALSLHGYSYVVLSPILAIAIMATLWQTSGRAAVLLKPLAWVGVASYSLYIWHYVLVELYGPLVIDYATWIYRIPALYTGLFLVICFGLSATTYWLIERPSMTTMRRAILKRL